MCERKCGRRAHTTITIRLYVVVICETCAAELFRAGLINRYGVAERR